MQKNREFLNTRDIAGLLGVGAPTVIRHMKAGKIPGRKLGGIWLCAAKDWTAYVAGTWNAEVVA